MSINHIGTIINKFEILDFKRVRQPKGYYYQYYLVRCPRCGNEKWMLRSTIDCPAVKSCGCERKDYFRETSDVRGKKFVKLTALYPIEEGGNYGKELWLCECECGNTLKVTPNHLNWGWVTNCGCLRLAKSGHKYISRKNEKWQARLPIDGKRVYLGVYNKLEDAVKACEEQKRVDTSLSSKNTSGYTGISKDRGKWIAYIGYQKKRIYLGSFHHIEEAIAARKEAEERYRSNVEEKSSCNI